MQQFSITLIEYMDRWQVQISEWSETEDEWGMRRQPVATFEFWSQHHLGAAALLHALWETSEFLTEHRESLRFLEAEALPSGGVNTISGHGAESHHVVGWTEAGGAEGEHRAEGSASSSPQRP